VTVASSRARTSRGFGLATGWLLACSFDSAGVTGSGSASIGDASDTKPDSASDSDDSTSQGSDASADTAGSAGQTDTDTDPVACDGNATCGAPAPEGWSGPFAIATAAPADPDASCPQGWPQHALAFGDPLAEQALCGCSCAPPGGTCGVTVGYFSDAACTAQTESGASSADCEGMYTQQSHDYVMATGVVTGATCASAPAIAVPALVWSEGAVLCAPPMAEACADGPCLPEVPQGFDGRWCVTAEGEQACPAGPYVERDVMYRSVADTRGCSACTCEPSGTATCGGTLDETFDLICLVPAGEIPVDGGCHASHLPGQNAWAVTYDPPPPNVPCMSNTAQPEGSAAPTDPITVCCAA
jgi:hypothetical protein